MVSLYHLIVYEMDACQMELCSVFQCLTAGSVLWTLAVCVFVCVKSLGISLLVCCFISVDCVCAAASVLYALVLMVSSGEVSVCVENAVRGSDQTHYR